MSRSLKLLLYLAASIAVVSFGWLTVKSYRQATVSAELRKQVLESTAIADGDAGVVDTNAATTNAASTNAAAPATNEVATATNVAAAVTNTATADTGVIAATSTRGYTRMVTHGLGLLLGVIGLAALIAHDVSHFLGHRAEKALFNDHGQPVDPEYEKAEQLWSDGKYLESIQGMREYLKKHPREQYVALRIAEIYEENLRNPLAAALEYEEVLTHNLPAERWGWAAIHLANIYSGKLYKSDKAMELLRRIDAEYGQTAAAKKARERLAQIDPTFVPAAVESYAAQQQPDAPDSNLPPGFRPKS